MCQDCNITLKSEKVQSKKELLGIINFLKKSNETIKVGFFIDDKTNEENFVMESESKLYYGYSTRPEEVVITTGTIESSNLEIMSVKLKAAEGEAFELMYEADESLLKLVEKYSRNTVYSCGVEALETEIILNNDVVYTHELNVNKLTKGFKLISGNSDSKSDVFTGDVHLELVGRKLCMYGLDAWSLSYITFAMDKSEENLAVSYDASLISKSVSDMPSGKTKNALFTLKDTFQIEVLCDNFSFVIEPKDTNSKPFMSDFYDKINHLTGKGVINFSVAKTNLGKIPQYGTLNNATFTTFFQEGDKVFASIPKDGDSEHKVELIGELSEDTSFNIYSPIMKEVFSKFETENIMIYSFNSSGICGSMISSDDNFMKIVSLEQKER